MGGTQSSIDPMTVVVPDLDKLLERDGYLKSYEREFRRRFVQVMFLFFVSITLPSQCHVEGHRWAMALWRYYVFVQNMNGPITLNEREFHV